MSDCIGIGALDQFVHAQVRQTFSIMTYTAKYMFLVCAVFFYRIYPAIVDHGDPVFSECATQLPVSAIFDRDSSAIKWLNFALLLGVPLHPVLPSSPGCLKSGQKYEVSLIFIISFHFIL
jgi:hypothetical protein